MMDNLDYYIFGLPIDTELGKVEFIKVRDYPYYLRDLQIISMSKLELIHKFQDDNKNGELDEFIKTLKETSLYEIVTALPELKQAYFNVYLKVFGDEDVVEMINADNFDYFRSLIMKMNFVKEEKINPNPEIQRALERSRRVKAREKGKLTLSDICSSVVAFSTKSYDNLLNFTIYQLYMTFYRISQIKAHETSATLATIPSEKPMDVEDWSKHIDPFKEESHTIDESALKKQAKSVFG